MTIKQQGGIFGRNPTFNDVDVESIDLSVGTVTGNLTLNGSGSGNGLIKNSGTGFSVGTDRWLGADGSDDAWFFNVPTGGQHYFAINNSNKLSISGNDVNVLLGNLIIGTSGKGIDFSATSGTGTSELFDDYEEGSFSGDVGSLTTNYTFTSKFGRYTKIGDMVTVWFRYAWTSANTGSGNTTFSVLPFAATEDGYVHITECTGNIAADQIHGRVISGTSSFNIYGRNNGSATQVGPAQKNIWNGAGGSNVLAGVAVYKA